MKRWRTSATVQNATQLGLPFTIAQVVPGELINAPVNVMANIIGGGPNPFPTADVWGDSDGR